MARYVVPLLAAALLLASCGGGHKAKPRLTGKAFRVQADAVCAETKTHEERLARLRTLRPPAVDDDLYAGWLKAERDAIEAARPPKQPVTEPLFDPHIPVTIAEGKIAGYARRLGAAACE